MQKTEIVAIDGGGTKTLLLRVRQDGTIAAWRKAGGSNPFDVPEWRAVLTGLMMGQQQNLAAAAFGMAGFGESGRLSRELTETLATLCPAPHSIHNDVDMACRGAFLNGPGILLLSGTGSMAWGMGEDGQTARVGGWGSLFGDEGSAYWIGRLALARLSQCLDGRVEDKSGFVSRFAALQGWPEDAALCGSALQEWYANLVEIRPSVAALAVEIGRFAEQGCEIAREIFAEAAEALACHVHGLRHRLSGETLRWSYAGGTMRSAILREALSRECGAPLAPGLPPIGGAVLVAASLAGWQTDERFIAQLAVSLEAEGLS
ncbi:N-acetylglucosamine kinase [Asaia spathodeae]|uniref:N-acetylglucosamine kinase n=1 Tax=Asaia spathodeae TaxID=657016 RepID=A0ABX2P0A9_9PROT|nr:BadF/BadG/BcrA/BcrD ATPase family protein [Asaia spathodeae]GBR14916.1 N-acetylglucosamine kinase [Asaia spathodeae NBRC 105894]